MIERLLSYATLLSTGLMSKNDYINILDTLFLAAPEDALLLDLEYVSSDINNTISIIKCYCSEHRIDDAVFRRYLMNGLKKAYYDSSMDINDFASKAYALWHILPDTMQLDNLFILCVMLMNLFLGETKTKQESYTKRCSVSMTGNNIIVHQS